MTAIGALISDARRGEADYSPAFTERVGGLGALVSDQIGIPIRHDSTMNYRVSQMLELLLSEDLDPVQEQSEAARLLKIVVSSRVPAWTLLVFSRGDRPGEWTSTSSTQVWGRLAPRVRSAILSAMQGAGLQQVMEADLSDEVDDAVTELDGAPATVKDFLFCELC